jgi:hypothetical protein
VGKIKNAFGRESSNEEISWNAYNILATSPQKEETAWKF